MKSPFKAHYRRAWLNSLVIAGILVGTCGCNVPRTDSKSTATLIQDASESLATQLAANLTANQKLRIGILPFSSAGNTESQDSRTPYWRRDLFGSALPRLTLNQKTGKASAIAHAFQEPLKHRLFLSKRFDVIEDTDMQKVLGELRIQEQGQAFLKGDSIHRMGELLGADAIVVGTITDLGSDFLINCRLIPVTSGVVGSVGEAKIANTMGKH